MDDIVVSQASAADKSDILLINKNVFGGLDYLEDYFDDFIRSRFTKLYKAVYNGEIICFLASTLVDDGKTVVTRAARVKPQFAGRGVFKMLHNHSLKMSTAGVNALFVSNALEARTNASFQLNKSFIMSKSFQRYDLSPNDNPAITMQAPEMLTKSKLEFFMTSTLHKAYLFPLDRIVVDWVPFKLLLSNIEILWSRDERSLRLTDVKIKDGQLKGLLSISSNYPRPGGGVCAQLTYLEPMSIVQSSISWPI